MNFLAHAYLSRADEDLLIGQLLGDFLEPGWRERLPARVAAGVRLHQRVDAFTDRHPAFLASRKRFEPRLRRYSGVLVDVFYDHLLARSWSRYHPDGPLEDFSASVYRALERRRGDLTARLARVYPRMAAQDWLSSYRRIEAVEQALAGISHRLSRPNPLAEGAAALRESHADFAADFDAFFPDLIAFAETETASLAQ